MRITIASFDEACTLLGVSRDNFAHVVSINCLGHTPPPELASHAARALVLHFDDIVKPTVIWRDVPSENDVARVIEFAHEITDDDAVLVHCAAGISRSAAVALTLLATREERNDVGAERVYRKLLSIKSTVRPNTAIIEHADRLLGFQRSLVQAHVREFPRDASLF
jgi:predicted protein tyrosine phosphatase